MINLFITIRFFDILDILIVAYLLFQLYQLIKGTVAFNIFIGIFLIYVFWFIIRALNMELISSLLGQFLGVGVLALIVVFQQEIRRFLLLIGSNEHIKKIFSTDRFIAGDNNSASDTTIRTIVNACLNMAQTHTGALIIIGRGTMLGEIVKTGEKINSKISSTLIETVFFKNSPLHDGAMIIVNNRIIAARCILPVTDRRNINPNLGLRHRAAIGITEESDAIAITVSEERGKISFCHKGEIQLGLNGLKLTKLLEEYLHTKVNYKDNIQKNAQ